MKITPVIPYKSQWDKDASLARGDCGIVCACMLALWQGKATTPDMMLRIAQLPLGKHSYTFSQVVLAADAAGIKLQYASGMTWEKHRAELSRNRPTIALIRYGELSGNLDDFDGSHFVVLTGASEDGQTVYVHDPDWWEPQRIFGSNRQVPVKEFEAAIGEALRPTGNAPFQALILGT